MLASDSARKSGRLREDSGNEVKRESNSVEREEGRGSGPVMVIFCLGGAGMDVWDVDDSASESDSESDSSSTGAALGAEAEWSPKKLRDCGRVAEEVSFALPFPLLLVFSFFYGGQLEATWHGWGLLTSKS